MSARHTLRDVRSVLGSRTGAASPPDQAYAAYAAVMLCAVLGFPLLRTLALWLAQPEILSILVASGATIAASGMGVLLAVFVVLGGIRGPVHLTPFLSMALAGNDLPRRSTLQRPARRSVLLLSCGAAAGSLLTGLVLASAGAATPASAVAFALGAVSAGVICGGFWLVGQRLADTSRAVVALALVGATALSSQLPAIQAVFPWTWLAAVFPAQTDVVWPALLALVAGAVATAFIAPVLLDGLGGPQLLRQAQRWDRAGTFAFTGDLSLAAGQFRPVPRTGRGLPAIGSGPLILVFLRRDLFGALRTPGRFVTACLGIASCGFLVAFSLAAATDVAWIPATAAAVVGFLALGVWSDGFRHSVESAAAPTLYGVSVTALFALHTTLPVLAGALCAFFGALWAVAVGAPAVGLAAAVACASVLVAVRLCDAAKGPLPLTLMAPVPSPLGDLSSIVVTAWMSDAVLVAVLAVVAIVTAVTGFGVAGLLIALPVLLAIMLRARRRISAL